MCHIVRVPPALKPVVRPLQLRGPGDSGPDRSWLVRALLGDDRLGDLQGKPHGAPVLAALPRRRVA
jgi:hypothetical protein